nr:Chain C, 9-mer peptide from Neuraminidase [Influenza A virus]3QQ3_F Chain F, 9-mer peptide from Neuraminidase [Influenza A virus]6KWN_C Chain C, peptide [Swine influenza virus]
NSDTVGWSW